MLRRPLARREHLHDRRGSRLRDGAHGLLDDIGEATLLVARRRICAAVGSAKLEIVVIPTHLFSQTVADLLGDAAAGKLLHTVAHLGDLGEHDGAATRDQKIGAVADGGVGGDA